TAYELGRAKRSALVASPSLAFVVVAAALGATRSTFLLGAAMFGLAAAFAQIGGRLARGVGPGLLYGTLPFVTASAAAGFGHLVMGDVCLSSCMPACLAAGTVTGFFLSRSALARHGGLPAWLASSSIVVLAGAIGCRCLGLGSVLGLVLGLVLTTVPALPAL